MLVTKRKIKNLNIRAFSLLELSIVIIIIGVLLAGVIGSKHLVKKAKINSAQAITRSSPISGTLGNKLWLETSLAEISLGGASSNDDFVTTWLDNSSNKTAISISLPTGSSGPTYSNSINSVQAIKFGSSSSTNYLQIDNASFLNGTDYTIFITEKRLSTNSGVGNYLLGEDGSFALGYESGTAIIQSHGEGSSSTNQANIESLTAYSNKPRVMVFTHSSTDGNKIYINATLSNEDTSAEAKAHLSGITTLALGKGYNGEIGEIAIFDRDLKTVERQDIENYLTDKWASPNNRDIIPSCTLGTVTSVGCDASCSAPSVNGITSSNTIADTASGSYACDDSGYIGTTTDYNCLNGSLSPTPDAGDCGASNGCQTGYLYNVSTKTCAQICDVDLTGSSTTTMLEGESGALSCDENGYMGDTSTSYSCSSGTITPTLATTQCYDDNGCDTGYSYDFVNEECACTGATTYNPATESCDLALDNIIGTLAGAYSVRKLHSGYTGNALRLRKDGASPDESDFGFNSDQELDTDAIETWLGSDNAWVVTWYDQSGNGNNFSQVNTSLQAPYTTGFGSNNKPTLDPDQDYYVISSEVSDFNFTDNFTFNFAFQYDGDSSPDYIWTKNSSKNIEISFHGSVNNLRLRGSSSTILYGSTSYSAGSNIVSQLTFDKSAGSNQLKYYSNNVFESQSTKTSSFSTTSGSTYLLSNTTNPHRWGGKISEVIIYSTTLSTSDLSKIAVSMSEYYGI